MASKQQDQPPLMPGRVPLVIGWKEFVEFPEWNISPLKVKIDTGARTSALDVLDYELVTSDQEELRAVLRLALNRKNPDEVRVLRVPVLQMVIVASSTGTRQQRPLIETAIRLGTVTKRVQLTITNR